MVALSRRFVLSSMVAGATFIAITSSAPEFGTAFAGVVFERSFEIGFQAIIWSALFNILVITGASAIVAPKAFKIEKGLFWRDMAFYIFTIAIFLILAWDQQIEGWENFILVCIYILYIVTLIKGNNKIRIEGEDFSRMKIFWFIVFGLAGVLVLSTVLVEAGVKALKELEDILNRPIPVAVVACTFWGPGTSIVDLMMSIKLSKKQNGDAAVVNGIASNTFDIAIVLGLNGILYNAMEGPIQIDLGENHFLIAMLGLSIAAVSILLLARDHLKKKHGWVLVGMFVVMLVIQIVIAFRADANYVYLQ